VSRVSPLPPASGRRLERWRRQPQGIEEDLNSFLPTYETLKDVHARKPSPAASPAPSPNFVKVQQKFIFYLQIPTLTPPANLFKTKQRPKNLL
jgi:hypothetical protein